MGKQVNDILKKICAELGYVQKKGIYYIKPISSNIYSTISFNIASYQIKGHRLVAPRIGVVYEDVEKKLRDISKYEWLDGYSNTVDEHIGYIMPVHDWTEWDLIEPGTNSEVVISDLKDSLQEYGDIYCRRYSNIYDVIEMIEGKPLAPAWSYLFARLPIMYYLVGRKRRGVEFINRVFKKEYSEVNIIFTDEYISNYMSLPDNQLDAK